MRRMICEYTFDKNIGGAQADEPTDIVCGAANRLSNSPTSRELAEQFLQGSSEMKISRISTIDELRACNNSLHLEMSPLTALSA